MKTLPHPLSNNRESCTYSPADTAALQTAGTLVAGLFTAATPSTWQQVVQTYTRSSAGTPINGLGDAALYGTVTEPGGSTAYVAVLHGTFVLFVELASFSANPPAVSQNQLVDLARTALGRI